ncbi:hypothetical protein CEE37_02990 [candidate division LCP-89 bacterium B3_LCP]|uniref:Uncharacterized protein n=1 Tax=candidate division LCP-89 bacterium B3_LCP TaxID=2012998 RepID=A0A532V2Y2_UNCL8|nr:MAG: hypothetical protein CEE37_02990 [candidate division LCP-89 bacterium B3_LCP]
MADNDPKKVHIRPFPYPYRAALTIANDVDRIGTFQELKAIHDVLNGTKDTPCGPGLGLEVGDSFHFFTVHPQQDDTLSYFDGLTKRRSSAASVLREGVKSGLLDTIHTWGNFSQKGGFFREYAQRAFEELDKYNLLIPVWTNHGDIHNFQNIGRNDSLGDVPEHVSMRGDRSEVLEYHFDIARQAGVRYIWIKELTSVVGQERSLDPQDCLDEAGFLGKSLLKGVLNKARGEGAAKTLQVANKLISPVRLRDGTQAYQMLRYGYYDKDGSDSLPDLITSKNLRRLVDIGGAMLLYVHLGKGRPSAETPFSPESYRALERLSHYAYDGDIWVTTTSRLCRYVELRRRLQLNLNTTGSNHIISTQLEPFGALPGPSLDGLTFYCDLQLEDHLNVDEETVPIVRNPVDNTGRISYSVPLAPLEYCWQ